MTAHPRSEATKDTLSRKRLRLWLRLLKASGLVEEEIRRRLRSDYSSTLPRFDVMSVLSRAPGGLKMGEISRRLRVSNGNITGIVDKLTEDGLTVRLAVPGDRRANLVRMTAKGQRVFAEHASAHEGWINDILGQLDEDDVEGMILRLDHLTETLLGERPDAP